MKINFGLLAFITLGVAGGLGLAGIVLGDVITILFSLFFWIFLITWFVKKRRAKKKKKKEEGEVNNIEYNQKEVTKR